MDFKTGKLHKVIREFQKGSGSYEINGVYLKNTVFLYREKASPFMPIPKGNYRTVFNENESTLIVDDEINNKAIEFQVISVFDIQASKYLEKFPELKMLVEHTNKIVDDINNIIEYLNSVGIKADSKFQTQILTPLEPSSTWYMNADGIIDTLPIDDFNKKFKEIIEKISETVDIKTKEQIQEKLETLKTEIETFKSKKITEITDNITVEKNNFIREIREVKDSSKRELDSRIPEINNKFNSIAGGQLNPSFIQDVGEKTNGQFYLDRNTSRLHKCIKTTSTTINSAEFFKDMSIDSVVNKLENLNTIKEERTKFTLSPINNVNLDAITEPGFYVSDGWNNNITNLPQEINKAESKAFYLTVYSLVGGAYCQQFLYSFKGLIFYRAITNFRNNFSPWRKINLS